MPVISNVNEIRKDWKPFTHKVGLPLEMAEPQHRIGPRGTSSGISLREFPKSCIQQVKEICLFYVNKCSGKYIDNKAAARYVYQMADEILKQLSGVAAQIRYIEQEPDIYRKLLDEWKDYFPESLGSLGTPKAIASKLNNQTKEIKDLKEQLEDLKILKEKQLNDLLLSVDKQIQAARLGSISERRVLQSANEKNEETFNVLLHENNEKHEKLRNKLIDQHNHDMNKLKLNYENIILKQSNDINLLNEAIKNNLNEYNSKINSINEKNNKKIDKMKKQFEKLKLFHKHSIGTYTSTDDNPIDIGIDNNNVSDFEDDEDDDDDVSYIGNDNFNDKKENNSTEIINNTNTNYKVSNSGMPIKNKIGKDKLKINRKQKENNNIYFPSSYTTDKSEKIKAFPVESLSPKRNTKLNQKFTELQNVIIDRDNTIDVLRHKLQQALDDCKSLRISLKGLEEINESLRRELTKYTSKKNSNKLIMEKPFVLAHTPHFLDKPDRNGMLSSNPTMTAYNNSGIF